MLKRDGKVWACVARRTRGRDNRGFTLVEMLISIALVLMMMVLFAEIFKLAGGSIGKMRGLAENDQRARTLQTVIKADLDKRTFRWVYPFAANEDTGAAGSKIGNREGYFYYSENDPRNKIDDVLQLTVMSTITIRNSDTSPYYGQATTQGPAANPFQFFNQPDTDDAQLQPNNTGLSTVAEVVYFVRNGNLYRRQLLLREPLSIAGTNPQPTDTSFTNPNGLNIFDSTSAALLHYPSSGQFWNDFDYSAHFAGINGAGQTLGAAFHGSDSLDNSTTSFAAIANPFLRFGFSPQGLTTVPLGATPVIPGRPKEFFADTMATTAADFMGRFTLEECSNSNYHYPQNYGVDLASASYVPTDPRHTIAFFPDSKTAQDFAGGPRRGEDLILANVHGFDIQVWDEVAGTFVDIGDPSLPVNSDYSLPSRYSNYFGTQGANSSFGPRIAEATPFAINAVFDTWHPQIDFDGNNNGAVSTTPPVNAPNRLLGQTLFDDPPYRPQLCRANAITGNVADILGWKPATLYNAGDIVFPTGPPGTTTPATTPAKLPYGTPFFYRCVQAGLSASSTNATYPVPATINPAVNSDYAFEPAWPQVAGVTVIEKTTTASPPPIWQAVDNRKPLKAIKIEIRFLDTSTQQMRQLTIVHSLVD